MATFMLTWELGAGFGHLMNLQPVAKELTRRGHRVVAALRDLSRAKLVFGEAATELVQAPIKLRWSANRIQPVSHFAHIMHNTGFGELNDLKSLTGAWRALYESINPDVMVADHSPTAVLAARSHRTRRAVIGLGFFAPPDTSPMPNLRPWIDRPQAVLQRDETRVLENINHCLRDWRLPDVDRVSQIFSDCDETLLLTFRELDHYGQRAGGHYYGAWTKVVGEPPQWPSGTGPRIYAYLKPFPALTGLLDALRGLRHPTIVVCDGIDRRLQQQFSSATLTFADRPLDIERVASDCDAAIINAGHGTTVALLLAGKPILQVPLFFEQYVFAKLFAKLGAGLIGRHIDAADCQEKLLRLLAEGRYQASARQFAEKYASFDPHVAIQTVVDRIEQLAPLSPAK